MTAKWVVVLILHIVESVQLAAMQPTLLDSVRLSADLHCFTVRFALVVLIGTKAVKSGICHGVRWVVSNMRKKGRKTAGVATGNACAPGVANWGRSFSLA